MHDTAVIQGRGNDVLDRTADEGCEKRSDLGYIFQLELARCVND